MEEGYQRAWEEKMMQIRAPSENVLNEWYNWLANADKSITKLHNWIVNQIPHVQY